MPSRAGVIYSTLGSNFPVYDAYHGVSILGASLPPGYQGIAVPFTPSASYKVAFMDFALLHLGGTNAAVVELCEDSSGTPGAIMGSWIVAGVPNAYAEVGLIASGNLTAGQQYWVTVLPDANDANLGWALNSLGATGNMGVTFNGSTYTFENYTLPAFDVLGDEVPEPSTLTFSVVGLVLLARRLWRS
jgi:hypothetical protein